MLPEQEIKMLIDIGLALTLGLPALVAVLGWIVGHWLNSVRERNNRRREARLIGLESAYKCLSMISNREMSEALKYEFERFVSEIQLYGTPKQIKLMGDLVEAFTRRDKIISFDSLLEDLRDTLRKELKMEKVSGPVWWYRFSLPKWKAKDCEQDYE
jgi:hypothetical protein